MDKYRLVESHPFEPFLPQHARVLMLGSFPPPEKRWSMRFYYPNKTNDMWRIMGLVFYGDKGHFLRSGGYDEAGIREFAERRGIAMYDAAVRVVRLQGNASDKFLEVVEPLDVVGMLLQLPECRTVVTAGEKSASIVAAQTGTAVPATGETVEFEYRGVVYTHVRMVSSSRAYPLAVEKKAELYGEMFRKIGMLE